MSAQLTVIRWRDIPAQVVAKSGRQSARRELSPRFQVAIDRAAMYAGLFGTDDYLGEWVRDSRPCSDDLEAEASSEADRLEAEFNSERLNDLANNGGLRRGTETGD
ncbi:MAG TPA: virulence factor [Acidimicrobiia bacterium]